jgi:two-component system CheB/CheR fusion protein
MSIPRSRKAPKEGNQGRRRAVTFEETAAAMAAEQSVALWVTLKPPANFLGGLGDDGRTSKGAKAQTDRPIFVRYAFAVVVAIVAVLVSAVLEPESDGMSLLLVPVLTLASASFGGLGPGFVTTLIASVSLMYFTFEPAGFGVANPSERLALMLLALNGVLTTVLWTGMRYAGERAKVAEAVAETEARYRVLFERNPGPMWVYDLETLQFLAINQAAIDHYGYSRAQFLSMKLEDIRPPEEIEPFLAAHAGKKALLEAGVLLHPGVFRHRKKDGAVISVDIAVSKVDICGRALGLVLATDVTDQMALQTQLTKARRDAETANTAKDRFLAILSHELRTPLTPILAAISAADPKRDTREEVGRRVAMIRRNAQLEARLIDDLLNVTRIVSGKLHLQLQPVCLPEVVRQVVDICETDLRAKQLELVIDLRARRQWIFADPERLHQVLWNLLKNAAKFTPTGGRITIESVDVPNERVDLSVTDTGAGIDPAEIERVFAAFEQLGPNRSAGGLGLGLTICKGLVEAQGGHIHGSSPGKGKGSTFGFEMTAAEGKVERRAPTRRLPSKRPLDILLVEDDEDTREILAELLRRNGHQVVTAGTLRDARSAAERQDVDLLISDIGLPDGSGLDVMEGFRGQGKPVRGIALSGYGMEEDVQRTRDAGFDLHLIKPITTDQLDAAIRSLSTDAPS